MNKLLFVVGLFISFSATGQGIVFETGTWDDALKKAEQEGKLIFVDAYTTWCGPCKAMAANVFTLSEAGSFYNTNFVNVKMDMESGPGKTFGNKYPVSAYPTLMFINAEGNIVKKAVGGQKLDGLLALGNEALKGAGPSLTTLEEKYTAGDRTYPLMIKYVTALNKSGKSTTKVIMDYFEKAKDLKESEKAMILFEGTDGADSKIFEEMIKLKKSIIEMVSLAKFEEKVETACRKTAQKAIEFELVDLLQESVSKAKQHLTTNKTLENELKLDYYKAFKNEKTYLETAEAFVKQTLNNNPLEVQKLITDMCTSFTNSSEIQAKAANFAKQLYNKQENLENLELYCITLVKNGEKEKALKEIEKAKSKIKNNEELVKKHELIYNKIKEYQ